MCCSAYGVNGCDIAKQSETERREGVGWVFRGRSADRFDGAVTGSFGRKGLG